MAFFSPEDTDGSVITSANSQGTAVSKIVAYRNALTTTSYAALDSGYKYQYDRYNDKYRYVPLNGDIAGLCARTDYTNDAWWSPGGLNRGQVKNVVKLAVSLDKTDRDNLYKNGVNPVVTFPGDGTVLFGDKTLLAKPSAFDRINVRRLFIVLEKAIATAAKYQLFEFNDGFTRAQFKNLVEPFLRDVQGRRGITDFVVKCDDSNNTGEVIDRNEFVADIFIKPARSINFITLNFVAARSGINFSEIGG
jgi:phage tail sheath protein FI